MAVELLANTCIIATRYSTMIGRFHGESFKLTCNKAGDYSSWRFINSKRSIASYGIGGNCITIWMDQ